MKIFRKPTVKDEQVKQHTEQSNSESESIPVFKEPGKRKEAVQDKGKSRNTLKHR